MLTWLISKKQKNFDEFQQFYDENYLYLQKSKFESRAIVKRHQKQSLDSILKKIRYNAASTTFNSNRQSNSIFLLAETETNEANLYLREPMESNNEEDILTHWYSISTRYPVLSRMIKNILAISVSEIEVKRLFSMTRDVVTYRRNRLRGQTIENIMIIKRIDWFAKDIDDDTIDMLSIIAKEINTTQTQNINETKNEKSFANTNWFSDSKHSNDNDNQVIETSSSKDKSFEDISFDEDFATMKTIKRNNRNFESKNIFRLFQ